MLFLFSFFYFWFIETCTTLHTIREGRERKNLVDIEEREMRVTKIDTE